MAESGSLVRLDREILPFGGCFSGGAAGGSAGPGRKPVKGPHREDDYRTKTLQGVGALDSIGEGLRAAREAQGHTIHDVSLATRIRASYVEALEADDFAALGGDVYVKGFLRSYAAFLGLDPEPLIAEYRDRYTTETSPGMRLQSMRESGVLASKEPRRRGWLPLGIGCVMVVLLLGVWSMVAGRGDPASAPTVAAPETTLPPPSTTLPPTTAPTTTTVSGEVEVVLRFEARSWASVKVDGEQAFRGVLSKGAERSFTGTQAVDVALGNGGGVLLTVNGSDLGRAGPSGRSFQRTFTVQKQQEPASGDGQETGQTSVTEATRRTVRTTRPYTQTTSATRSTARTTRTPRTTRASDTDDLGDEGTDVEPGSGGGRRRATATTTEGDENDDEFDH